MKKGTSFAAKGRFSRDDRGAAEMIGDILLVAMSVVMVSALALQLSTVQTPTDSVRVDLGASYDGSDIEILHMGGDKLENAFTTFYLFVNDSLKTKTTIAAGLGGDGTWEMGERWVLNFPTNLTDRLRVEVIDTRASAVILDQIVQRGPSSGALPDLGLAATDIRILFRGADVNDSNAPMAGDNVTLNITLHNYGSVIANGSMVRISDYSNIDRRSYAVYNATLNFSANEVKNLSIPYRLPAGSWGMHVLTVRLVPLPEESRFANNYASKQFRVGYLVIATNPGMPVLRIRSIEFYPRFPVHGQYVNITARISNQGGVPAVANVTYYEDSPIPAKRIGTETGLGVPVGGETVSTMVWKATRGGVHTIHVNASDPAGLPDQQAITVDVLPTILLVDDDRAGEGGLRDVITPMKAALDSVAASYSVHAVPGGDGPRYEGGEHPLKDYDLVIWMCGYEDANTLTPNDRVNLTDYLNNNGRLWLIGQDVLSSLGRSNPFLNNYMKVDPLTPLGFLNSGTPDPVLGSGIISGTRLNITKPFPTGLPNRGDYMEHLPTSTEAFTENGGGSRAVGILFNDTTNGTPGADTYRTAFFGFEPTRLVEFNDLAMMVYEMLVWFNCSATWGRDLAVSDQRFDKTSPAFMESVNITVYLRNNGLDDEPVDVSRPQLQVGFYVDGAPFDPKAVFIDAQGGLTEFDPPTSEFWVPQDTTNASIRIPGKGGFIKISMLWVADRIGAHTITGRIDPYDYIPEINEGNNQVSASLARELLHVRYGTLVVDDDGSANNGGALYNSTQNLTAALDFLGYQYDTFTTTGAGNGPDLAKLELYNAILWCAGEASDVLTGNDKTALSAFLGKGDGRYLWLSGPQAISDGDYTGGADAFVRDYLRLARVVDPGSPNTPSSLEGARLDPIAHGARYAAQATFTDTGRLLVPFNDGQGMMYQSPAPVSSTNEVAYFDGSDGTTEGWYARVVPVGTTSTITNVQDVQKGSRVVSLNRAGANPQDSFFIIGDFAVGNDQNPSDLPWMESRYTASWSFISGISYTFKWHVTDNLNNHHTLTYTDSDLDLLGVEPVHHGLGGYTANGQWHAVTRDLTRDLREGFGWAGLNIRRVDGFEVGLNAGTIRVDDIELSQPYNSVRHDNSTNNFRTVVTAWDLSFASRDGDPTQASELAYLVMRWFNLYDERTELRITRLDLYHTNLTPLREMKPMMGESYMLKAMVWNPGGTRGEAVVRFSDGSTVIDSVSVSVGENSFILAEVIWTPLFAGTRTISVAVDPDGLLGEIFKFNNLASQQFQCYFFYDDMESGVKKWYHESTIARINGESPLEYLDAGSVHTDVISEWSEYDGWKNNTDNASLVNLTRTYHSQDRSFYMHEPAQSARTPVDVMLTCDATGSMTTETPCRTEGVKTAMFQFVNRLKSTDRGAVASFSTSRALNSNPNPPLIPFYTELHQGLTLNKQLLHDAIANITVAGATPFWNAVTVSFTYMRDHGDVNHVRCVVILTDGLSNSDRPNIPAGRTAAFNVVTTGQVPLFVIGYGMGIRGTAAETAMISLAAQANNSGGGGGWYYFAPNANEIGSVFANISKAIEDLAQTLGRSAPEAVPAMTPPAASGRHGTKVTLFQDNMEMGVNGWTVVNLRGAGSTWQRVYNGVRNSGAWSWRAFNGGASYINNDDDWLITPAIDARGYHNLTLSFWHRPGLYRRDGWGCDFGYVFVSNDDGATWYGMSAHASTLYSSGSSGTLTVTDMDLGLVNPSEKFRIAFRQWTDPWTTGEGWVIDDVVVKGELGWTARGEEGGAAPEATIMIMQDGFESAAPAWTATSNQIASSIWRRDNSVSHSDAYSYRCFDTGDNQYKDRDDDTLGSPTFNLSGYLNPRLSFWSRTDLDSGENCHVYVSNDNGATWTLLLTRSAHVTSWVQEANIDLTNGGAVVLTAQMKLRFHFLADNNNDDDEGWSIDDILVTAETPAAGTQPGAGPPGQWNDGDNALRDRRLTTSTFSLAGVSSARLTFWHRYNLKVGSNGGVLQVGTSPTGLEGSFTYRYISPTQPYPSNLRIAEWGSAHLQDGLGNDMRWCWNGVSGAGQFSWDHVEADLTPYAGTQHVRVRFLYLYCGGGTGWGWAIDDVEVKVRRSDSVAASSDVADQWELVKEGNTLGDDYVSGTCVWSGSYSWWNHHPQVGTDYLKGGIDNSLQTIPIDLSRAKDARLNAMLKFNILYPEGRPPDGFRVEVTSDNGITWRQLNMGVRTAWNVSGTEAAGADGTSYTGVDAGDGWVRSSTLTRLNCDLSGWAGEVIMIRFRVVTRDDAANHYYTNLAGFGGFYIDDVTVTGNTTTGQGRSAPPAGPDGDGPPGADGRERGEGERSRDPAGPVETFGGTSPGDGTVQNAPAPAARARRDEGAVAKTVAADAPSRRPGPGSG